MRFLKRYFITGLLIWLPLVATLWVLAVLVSTLGSLVPSFLSPEAPFGAAIPRFELALVLAILLATAMCCATLIGRALPSRSESLLRRIPLARSISNSVTH